MSSWYITDIKLPDFVRNLTIIFSVSRGNIDGFCQQIYQFDVIVTSSYVIVSIKFAYMLEMRCAI